MNDRSLKNTIVDIIVEDQLDNKPQTWTADRILIAINYPEVRPQQIQQRDPIGQTWTCICNKVASYAKAGDMIKARELISFMDMLEKEYPDNIKSEKSHWEIK